MSKKQTCKTSEPCSEISDIQACIKKHDEKLKNAFKKEIDQLEKCITQTTGQIKKLQVSKKTAQEKYQLLRIEYQKKATKSLLLRMEKAKTALGKFVDELKSKNSCLASCKETLKNRTAEYKKLLEKEKALAVFEKTWLKKQSKKPSRKRKVKK